MEETAEHLAVQIKHLHLNKKIIDSRAVAIGGRQDELLLDG